MNSLRIGLNLNCNVGGGQIEPCDIKIIKTYLCSYHNNTALIKLIPLLYCLSREKYL